MKNKKRTVFSGIALNTYGTLVYFFCQWVLTVLVARLNGYADAGVFSLAISFANIFAYIELWGVRNFQISDIQEEYSNGMYAGARIISTIIALVLIPPVLMYYNYERTVVVCCLIAVAYKTFESVTDLFFGVMQRTNRYDCIAVSYTLKGLLPAVAFAVLLAIKYPLHIAMIGMLLVYMAVVVLYDAVILRGSGVFQITMRGNGKLLKLCLPLMINGLISACMIYLPRNAVQQIIGSEELGFYSSISTVVVVLSTLVGSVWAALMPTISKLVNERDAERLKQYYWRILGGLLAMSLVVVVVGNLLGPMAFSIVYGKEILSHMHLLTPVLLNAVFLMIDAYYDCFFIPMKKRMPLLICNGVGFLFCAATVRIATASFGTIGACYSMTGGLLLRFVVLFMLNSIYLNRISKEKS